MNETIDGHCANCLLEFAIAPLPDTVPLSLDAPGLPTHSAPIRSFGDYELLEEIARGGMGVVYRARQVSLNRIVALKMILAGNFSSATVVQRFQTEAEAAARLEHPNIVPIYEIGRHEGQHYFSMRFLEGGTLTAAMARERFTPRRAAELMIMVARAVHHAHQHGILHRDLKPGNILLDRDGEPHVADFGLAKLLETDSVVTHSQAVLGTPSYIAPEQASGRATQLSTAADVYGLGAIFYELLTSHPPFQADTALNTLRLVVEAEPTKPRLHNSAVDRDLETVCLKCLEKIPTSRYGSAEALVDDLRRWLKHEPVAARRATAPERLLKWAWRNPVMAASGAVGVLLLLAIAAGSTFAALRIKAEQTRAEQGELSARRSAYALAINLAQRSLDAQNLGRAQELLDRQRPSSGQWDLRGWEWRYLWQQSRGDLFRAFCQTSNIVGSLSASHDGNWLAVGDHHQGGLSIWNRRNPGEVVRLRVGEDAVHVAFSPRESLLAAAGVTAHRASTVRSSVHFWDGHSRQTVGTLELPGACRALAFADDGETLVTVTFAPDNQIILWNVSDRRQRAAHPINAVAHDAGTPFALAGDLSAAAHVVSGARIRVLDLASGSARWIREAGKDVIQSLAFSRDGKLLASGAGLIESEIRLWNVETGAEVTRLNGHRLWVSALLFLPDGKTLASSSADQTIRLWNLTDLENVPPPKVLSGHQHEIWRLALQPDNKTIASGAKDGSVLLWDTSAEPQKLTHVRLNGPFESWHFGKNGETVLTCNLEGRVSAWGGTGFLRETPLLELGRDHLQYRFSGDGDSLAAGSSNGMIKVWNLLERTRVSEFRAATGPVFPQFFLAQGSRLVTHDPSASSYAEWNIGTGEKTKEWRDWSDRTVAAAAPDGKTLLFLGYDGMNQFCDLVLGRETKVRLDLQYAQNAAFSPDGKLFAAASDFGLAKVWATSSLSEVATMRSVLMGFHSVAFSPDASRLAIGGHGAEAIKLWELPSGEELISLAAPGAAFEQSAFSPDGNVLASLNREGALHLWLAPGWAEIEAAEQAGNIAHENLFPPPTSLSSSVPANTPIAAAK